MQGTASVLSGGTQASDCEISAIPRPSKVRTLATVKPPLFSKRRIVVDPINTNIERSKLK